MEVSVYLHGWYQSTGRHIGIVITAGSPVEFLTFSDAQTRDIGSFPANIITLAAGRAYKTYFDLISGRFLKINMKSSAVAAVQAYTEFFFHYFPRYDQKISIYNGGVKAPAPLGRRPLNRGPLVIVIPIPRKTVVETGFLGTGNEYM